MKRGPPVRDGNDEGEPALKRAALVERVAELQQNGAQFAQYDELLPELKQVVGARMAVRDILNWLQTHRELADPKFLAVFWKMMVDMDYRSPFTDQPHRFVVHATAAFTAYCQRQAEADKAARAATFWRATYLNAGRALRIALYVLADHRLYVIDHQVPAEFHVVAYEHCIASRFDDFGKEDTEVDEAAGFDLRTRWTTIARNNWLALASSSPRRRNEQREAIMGTVGLTATYARYSDGETPVPQIQIKPAALSVRLDFRGEYEYDDDAYGMSAAMSSTPAAHVLRGALDAENPEFTLFSWAGRTVFRARVDTVPDTFGVEYRLFVDAIDIDAMLDWAAAHVTRSSRPEARYWCVNNFFRFRARGTEDRYRTMPAMTRRVVRSDDDYIIPERPPALYCLATTPFDQMAEVTSRPNERAKDRYFWYLFLCDFDDEGLPPVYFGSK